MVKKLLEDLEEKERLIGELRKQLKAMESKEVESLFLSSHVEALEEENLSLRKEIESLRKGVEYNSGEVKGEREEVSSPLYLLRKMSSPSAMTTARKLVVTRVEKKVEGLRKTLGKPIFADNQKMVTDEEGRIVEISFKRMLTMLGDLDGNALTKHKRTIFLCYKKLGVSPPEMFFYMVELFCGVQRGDNQERGWRKVLSVLKYWIKNFVHDFQDDEMEDEFFNFLEDTVRTFIAFFLQKYSHFTFCFPNR